jgi:transcriptional regulator NrdR family protein
MFTCPNCFNKQNTVKQTRTIENSTSIMRRRECKVCGYRWSTYEDFDSVSKELMLLNRAKGMTPIQTRETTNNSLRRALNAVTRESREISKTAKDSK